MIKYICLLIVVLGLGSCEDAASPDSPQNRNVSELVSSELCDLVTEAGICLFNGEKVLTSDAQPKGLVGHWSFDDSRVLQ